MTTHPQVKPQEKEGEIRYDQVKTTCVDGRVFHNYLDWCYAGAPAIYSVEIIHDQPTEPPMTSRDEAREKEAVNCPTCNGPCDTEILMRGGDHGWGTTDLERTVYNSRVNTHAHPQAENARLREAARDMLAERDRMVTSGQYNDLAGVAHRLRAALQNSQPKS